MLLKEIMLKHLSILICALVTTLSVSAQSWPTRPIKLVVPFPPGGLIDNMARLVSNKLSQELGEDVNRALNEQRWALVISSSAGSQQNVERLRGAFDQLRAGAKLWCVSFYVASRFLGR